MNKKMLKCLSIFSFLFTGYTLFSSINTFAANAINVDSGIVAVDPSDGKCALAEALANVQNRSALSTITGECAAGIGDDIINVPSGIYDLTHLVKPDLPIPLYQLPEESNLRIQGDLANRPSFVNYPLEISLSSNSNFTFDSIDFKEGGEILNGKSQVAGVTISERANSLGNTNITISNSDILNAYTGSMMYAIYTVSKNNVINLNNIHIKNSQFEHGPRIALFGADSKLNINNFTVEDSVIDNYIGLTAEGANSVISINNLNVVNSDSQMLMQLLEGTTLNMENSTITNQLSNHNYNTDYFLGVWQQKSNINLKNILYKDNKIGFMHNIGCGNTIIDNSIFKENNTQTTDSSLITSECGKLDISNSYLDSSVDSNNASQILLQNSNNTESIFTNNTFVGNNIVNLKNNTSSASAKFINNTFNTKLTPFTLTGLNNISLYNNIFTSLDNSINSERSCSISEAITAEQDNYGTYLCTPKTTVVTLADMALNPTLAPSGNILSPVGYNGTEQTLTYALLPTSQVLEKATTNCPAIDQRGISRTLDKNTTCDVGAFELGALGEVTINVFEDANGNGIKDEGEKVIPDFKIMINSEYGQYQELLTDANGDITFDGSGKYSLNYMLKGTDYADYSVTTPSISKINIDLGQQINSLIGLYLTSASVSSSEPTSSSSISSTSSTISTNSSLSSISSNTSTKNLVKTGNNNQKWLVISALLVVLSLLLFLRMRKDSK